MIRATVAVLIDLANIVSAFDIIKSINKLDYNIKIDFNKLISAVTLGNEVVSKSVYVGTRETADKKAQQSFLNYFKKSGFRVVSKECKIIHLDDGATKQKANFDVEIALDACSHIWKRECSEMILISGDSDFAYLVDKAKEWDFKITVVSSRATVSRELREKADRLILLDDLDLNYLGFNKNGS